jgi:hypothetical protein
LPLLQQASVLLFAVMGWILIACALVFKNAN